MILVDLNQIIISNIMQEINSSRSGTNTLEPGLMKHMVLNTLRHYRQKFGEEYGELVICCDDKNYWRRDLFPYYKLHRKKQREESPFDWNSLFEQLNEMREDLREHFPYRVLQVERCEADDIIATLCHKFGTFLGADRKILILSSDKDFVQLQKYSNVDQFSPIHKKFLREANPHKFIRQHIMKGDKGDGIPNFLSDDDCIINSKRQKPIRATKLETWIEQEDNEQFDEKMLRGFKRNEALINLDMIPLEYQNKILQLFEGYENNDRSKMFNYFVKNKLKNLMNSIQEF